MKTKKMRKQHKNFHKLRRLKCYKTKMKTPNFFRYNLFNTREAAISKHYREHDKKSCSTKRYKKK